MLNSEEVDDLFRTNIEQAQGIRNFYNYKKRNFFKNFKKITSKTKYEIENLESQLHDAQEYFKH